MRQLMMPQTDIRDRQPQRHDQTDDMELLIAASEAQTAFAGWLVDRRLDARFEMRETFS